MVNFEVQVKEITDINLNNTKHSYWVWVHKGINIVLTFPFSGMALFIILAMLAIGRNLSCSLRGTFLPQFESELFSSCSGTIHRLKNGNNQRKEIVIWRGEYFGLT